jgi:hypothetical protein
MINAIRKQVRKISEAAIQKTIIARLHNAGWLTVRFNSGAARTISGGYVPCYWIAGSPRPNAGLPDVIAWKDGQCLLLEVKTASGKLRAAQRMFATIAEKRGTNVHVVRSWEDVQTILQTIETNHHDTDRNNDIPPFA